MKQLGATPLEELNEAMGDVVVEYFMDEGIARGRRNALVRQLRTRFGELPESAEARVKAADSATLDVWLDRVLTAPTLDEVFAES